MDNIYIANKDTEIRFHQEPTHLQFLDAAGRALFRMPYDLWQKMAPEKQEQMGKELQDIVDKYAEEAKQ